MDARGPRPFITMRCLLRDGHRIVLRARQHRKGLQRSARQKGIPFWHRPAYNWWNGLLFAVGSLHFIVASLLSVVDSPLTIREIALVFFAGSIFFTTAGFMQNLQAANAGEMTGGPPETRTRLRLIGWKPSDVGWLSTITQFAGTVMFNFNTFDAIDPPAQWYLADLTIWLPGLVGSVLFLVSGYLAFMEAGHGWWSWKPADLDWQIVTANLLGCIFFMGAGILAYIPRGPEPAWIATSANVLLCLGAVGFLAGALLMMRESRQAATLIP
ncbi:MAG: hypothetical protein CMN86_22465 [Stappia sp.]|uniref:hypothetical protein n=1 Tax=Stappia sp. TaxID=1870903 RepID=UPI000C98F30A|nr:hypothetical protein [Stappia sp.]